MRTRGAGPTSPPVVSTGLDRLKGSGQPPTPLKRLDHKFSGDRHALSGVLWIVARDNRAKKHFPNAFTTWTTIQSRIWFIVESHLFREGLMGSLYDEAEYEEADDDQLG